NLCGRFLVADASRHGPTNVRAALRHAPGCAHAACLRRPRIHNLLARLLDPTIRDAYFRRPGGHCWSRARRAGHVCRKLWRSRRRIPLGQMEGPRHARPTVPLHAVAALTVPITVAILIAGSDRSIYVLYPLLQLVIFLPAGSAAAAVQESVLPRMRATAGAILLLAYCVGLALGPYTTARLSSLTGSLRIGMLGVLAMAPIAVCMFGLAARDIGLAEATRLERARAAGEFC